MNFLILSETKHINMISFLKKRGNVKWESDKIIYDNISHFDWIISYGYRYIISNYIIKKVRNPIINLHISYLPHNRGAHPNYWSFKDNTPKGITIHFIDSGIDTGPILIQKKINFGKEDTLKKTYLRLKIELEELFYKSFDKIISNKITAYPQKGKGSFHYKKDLPKTINWNLKINKIK